MTGSEDKGKPEALGLVKMYHEWLQEAAKLVDDIDVSNVPSDFQYEKLMDEVVDRHFLSQTRIVHLRVWDAMDEGPDAHITAWYRPEEEDTGWVDESYLELVDAVSECDGDRVFFVKNGAPWFKDIV